MTSPDLFVELVKAGVPPDEVAAFCGSAGEISGEVDYLARSFEYRLQMTIARRAGLPLSEVMDRWTREDLIAEIAFTTWETVERSKSCVECGVPPDDILDRTDPDRVRELGQPRLKLVRYTCWACRVRAGAESELSKTERENGVHLKWAEPRPGCRCPTLVCYCPEA